MAVKVIKQASVVMISDLSDWKGIFVENDSRLKGIDKDVFRLVRENNDTITIDDLELGTGLNEEQRQELYKIIESMVPTNE